ncbi:MAG: PilN domain-containing protein [Armatimonadota bacterium]|nr:PilN domain-containing protein [Armatimonadota bacterium]MDR5697252.1 PilN domain-containing protein [Armatimonadota bacterium]
MTIRINLLAPERKRRPGLGPVGWGLLVVLVVAVGLVVYGIVLQGRMADLRRQIADHNAEIERIRPQAAEVERMKRAVESLRRRETLIQQFFASQIPAAEAVSDLSQVIPQDTWLTAFSVQGGRAVQVDGTTTANNESVAVFMVNLEQSPYFRNVDLSVSERQAIGQRNVSRFTLTAELEGSPRARASAEDTGGTR